MHQPEHCRRVLSMLLLQHDIADSADADRDVDDKLAEDNIRTMILGLVVRR